MGQFRSSLFSWVTYSYIRLYRTLLQNCRNSTSPSTLWIFQTSIYATVFARLSTSFIFQYLDYQCNQKSWPTPNWTSQSCQLQYPTLIKTLPWKTPPFFLFQDWEDFPDPQIKFIHDRFGFNLKLKNHFLNQLSDVPVCNRLLCPVCHL